MQGHKFTIRTDQQALKHLLDQKIVSPLQQKWVSKLLGFNYDIHYKKGSDNKVADALSRRVGTGECAAISTVTPMWMQQIFSTYIGDKYCQGILEAIAVDATTFPDYEVVGDILRFKGLVVVGSSTKLRQDIIKEMHNTAYGGHSGIQGTYMRVKRVFYWPNLKTEVLEWIQKCDVCHRSKSGGGPYPGLLQPLPILEQAWTHITMDFIEGLPTSQGKKVIFVVVDRLTKYSHFLPLSHPYTAQSVAKVFLDNIYKLHGAPLSIVSDRDKVFTSLFWKELFRLMGTTLEMSSAYHPQTDGLTERVNQCVETYLRCMVQQNPKQWALWLPLAEFWYNTNYHTSLKTTPFDALYGFSPQSHPLNSYLPNPHTDVVDIMGQRQQKLQELKENLTHAQHRMKLYADKRRSEREFQEGEFVYLKLQPTSRTL